MKKIKLRHRVFLSLPTESKAVSEFLQNAINFLRGSVINRIWATDPTSSINEIKRNNFQFIKQYNVELSELAKFYLSKEKPILPYLLERHQIQYDTVEAEIFDMKFNNPNSLVVAVDFFTKEYTLRENFGQYLLLSKIKEDGSLENEIFMVELKAEFSIYTYSA
jgi:hypothetical protein